MVVLMLQKRWDSKKNTQAESFFLNVKTLNLASEKKMITWHYKILNKMT